MKAFEVRKTVFERQALWWKPLVFVAVAFTIWLPRGSALDRIVTPDEPSWLTNSANFYRALARGDLHQTYQIEHPGVTATWVGTAAFLWRYPAYADDAPGQLDWRVESVDAFIETHGHEPLRLLKAGRVIMVTVITVVLAVAFWWAVRLLGFWPALVGFLLIATDPFHIAHSRLLHLDGLLSSLMLLSLLAFMTYLYRRGGRRLDLLVSGLAAGLAWLTKTPTFFLVPFAGLLLLLQLETKQRQRSVTRKDLWCTIHSLVLWGTVAGLVFVLLWPAMWVDPIYTVRRVLGATLAYAAQGHEAALYFDGAIVDGDPGFHFYPVTYLWRTTPAVLAGLGLAAAFFAAPKASSLRRAVATLVLFAILFTLFMSLGAKKFDRYLLPIYAPLNLVAGAGWVAAVRWLMPPGLQQLASQTAKQPEVAMPLRLRQFSAKTVMRQGGAQDSPQRNVVRVLVVAVLFLATFVQIRGVVTAFPYFLSYYNPLLGGTLRAPAVMMVGWGEGLDQAAQYLNSHDDIADLQVVSGVWNGSFSYFFKGKLQWSVFDPGTSHVEEWTTTDYLVIYINQWQRGRLPQELLAYLAQLTPVRVIRLQGLEYVYIYDLRGVPPPSYLVGDEVNEKKAPNRDAVAGKGI